jgi:cytochrome c oxidase assembly protein subunit 11
MAQTNRNRSNQRGVRLTAASIVIMLSAMVGLVVVSEPLYKLFCKATGYNGTPRVDVNGHSSGTTGEKITVRFDSNVNRDIPWRFHPVASQVNVHLGEEKLAFFEATNTSDETIVGTATFNVMPERVAQYFNKIQCFCFTQQVLKPGETVQMPVTFFIDPDMMNDAFARDIKTVTLSYTFFLDKDQSKAKPQQQPSYSN